MRHRLFRKSEHWCFQLCKTVENRLHVFLNKHSMHMKSQRSVCAGACVRVCVRACVLACSFQLCNNMADLTTLIFILLMPIRFNVPSENCKKALLASSRLSVYPFTPNSFVPTAWTVMKFDASVFVENL